MNPIASKGYSSPAEPARTTFSDISRNQVLIANSQLPSLQNSNPSVKKRTLPPALIQSIASYSTLRDMLQLRCVNATYLNALSDDRLINSRALADHATTIIYRNTLLTPPSTLDANLKLNFIIQRELQLFSIPFEGFRFVASNNSFALSQRVDSATHFRLTNMETGEYETVMLDTSESTKEEREMQLKLLFNPERTVLSKQAVYSVSTSIFGFRAMGDPNRPDSVVYRFHFQNQRINERDCRVLKLSTMKESPFLVDRVIKIGEAEGESFLLLIERSTSLFGQKSSTVLVKCSEPLECLNSDLVLISNSDQVISNSRYVFSTQSGDEPSFNLNFSFGFKNLKEGKGSAESPESDKENYLVAHKPSSKGLVLAWKHALPRQASGKLRPLYYPKIRANEHYVVLTYKPMIDAQNSFLDVFSLKGEKLQLLFTKVLDENSKVHLNGRLLSYWASGSLAFVDLGAPGGPLCVHRRPSIRTEPEVYAASPRDIRILNTLIIDEGDPYSGGRITEEHFIRHCTLPNAPKSDPTMKQLGSDK